MSPEQRATIDRLIREQQWKNAQWNAYHFTQLLTTCAAYGMVGTSRMPKHTFQKAGR